ncbi:ribbon-helix-helix protein, CopG family [Lachnospiraceae bacterium MD329]|nr:ribbon-helix-helix protein, CopG family [Lachnospiraceae bacterium MD329]
MRTRQHRIHIHLTDDEKKKLDELKEMTGLTASAIVRTFLSKRKKDRILRPKPDENYGKITSELFAISNNLNQINRVAERNNDNIQLVQETEKEFKEMAKLIRRLYL